MSAHTLRLDLENWDLGLDGNGNIATVAGDYAIAQNVANAVRLFTNDAYYEPEKGIPHFTVDLKRNPQESLVRSNFIKAASGVDGVKEVEITSLAIVERNLSGEIAIRTDLGGEADVAF